MSKRHILTINSNNGLGGNVNNLDYNLNERDLHESKAIIYKSFCFNNIIYNINSYNNTLRYNLAGVPTTVVIPVGNYNVSTFITQFNTSLAGNIVIADNATTKKFSFTSPGNTQILATSTIKRILGITVNTANSTAYTGDSIYNFIYTYNLHIQSHNLAENDNIIATSGRQYAILATIPLSSGFGFVEYNLETLNNDFSILSGKSNLSHFSIQLLDDEYRPVEMNNAPYVLQLIIK